MRFTRIKYGKLYGHDVEERYTFKFGDEGELSNVKLEVKIDENGSGYVTTEMVKKHNISVEEVPQSIRDEVSDMLSTAASEI